MTLQIGAVVAGFGAMAVVPPAQGRLLAVPMTAAAEATMLSIAIDRGAMLVGAGPFPGSYILSGRRARIAGPLLESGVVVIAAPASECGAARTA